MEERRNQIVELINQKGNISFTQLKEAFPNVSEMTLRSDLKALDQERRIIRIHGGAKSVDVVVGTDDLLGRRSGRNQEEKRLIAKKAVELIGNNRTVYLDSGSTATALARSMKDEPCLIVTNSLSCAMELARLEKPKVVFPGGVFNRYSMSMCGAHSIRSIQMINFDIMFLGVTSYSTECGFTCGIEEEACLKQEAMKRAERVVVLMDSSKIGFRHPFTICGLEDIDVIISDGKLPVGFQKECRLSGVEIL